MLSPYWWRFIKILPLYRVRGSCKLDPKSLQKLFQSGLGMALNRDSVSNVKEERARSVEGAAAELRGSTKLRILEAWEGNREGAVGFTRLTTLQSGVGGYCETMRCNVM